MLAPQRTPADALEGSVALLFNMHPDEPLSKEVAEYSYEQPEVSFDLIQANPQAAGYGRRFVDCELSTACPVPGSALWEERWLPDLIDRCQWYPLIIDIHNSRFAEYAFAGPYMEPGLLRVAAFFGRRQIVIEKTTFNDRVPRALGLEFVEPKNEAEFEVMRTETVPWIYRKMSELALFKTLSDLPEAELDSFDFFRRFGRISQEEAARLDLANVQITKPFQELPREVALALGRSPNDPPLYVWWWDSKTPGPSFGGLVERCDPPERVLGR